MRILVQVFRCFGEVSHRLRHGRTRTIKDVVQVFPEWTKVDGVVAGVTAMQRIRTDLTTAIQSVDPSSDIHVTQTNH